MNINAPRPVLYIFAGLPGAGKTTLGRLLAGRLKAAYVRIDTLEQALRDACSLEVQAQGYIVGYGVAADNLANGVSVVADSCNPVEVTRRAWERVAIENHASYINIEIICSDAAEHRQRIEMRTPTIPGLRLPTWMEVEDREYHDWTVDRIVLDTAGKSERENIDELLLKLSGRELNNALQTARADARA